MAETRVHTRPRRNYIDLTIERQTPPGLPSHDDIVMDYAQHIACGCRTCKEAPSIGIKSFDWLSRKLLWTLDPGKRESFSALAGQYRDVLVEVLLLHRVIETDRDQLCRLRRCAFCSDCQMPMHKHRPQVLQCGHTFCVSCVKHYIKSAEEAGDEPRCIDCQEVITRYKPNYQLGELVKELEEPAT